MSFYNCRTLRRLTAPGLLTLGALILGTQPSQADDGPAHQAAQYWPIELGVSGGNINDRSVAYCCSGTLGGLVQDANGVLYILSNNHVLGRANQAVAGEPVNHPGMIDQSCQDNGILAEVSQVVPLQFRKGRSIPINSVDAAMAQVIPGAVYPDGRIKDIGGLGGGTVAAMLGQAVQKSGRTTGHTFGVVNAIDVTVEVGYSRECGGAANQIARFEHQISISDGDFSAGGDSGSIVVEAAAGPDGLPRAVGLLFAGSDVSTLANPIDSVLAALNVTMLPGLPPTPPATGQVGGVVAANSSGTPIAGATVTTDTGESVTTDASGVYLISSVPVGNRTVSATAAGYAVASQVVSVDEDLTAAANFSLAVQTGPSQTLVECVTYDTSGGKSNDRNLLITISVIDDLGNPVPSATVGISVTQDGAAFGSGSGTTGAGGELTFNARNAPNATYVTTVTGVSKDALTFKGVTPANSFTKGTDGVPAAFCVAGATGAMAAGGPEKLAAELDNVRRIKARHSNGLFNVPSVVGHGISIDRREPVIEIYLSADDPAARRQIPVALDGIPVRVIVTGPFNAY